MTLEVDPSLRHLYEERLEEEGSAVGGQGSSHLGEGVLHVVGSHFGRVYDSPPHLVLEQLSDWSLVQPVASCGNSPCDLDLRGDLDFQDGVDALEFLLSPQGGSVEGGPGEGGSGEGGPGEGVGSAWGLVDWEGGY